MRLSLVLLGLLATWTLLPSQTFLNGSFESNGGSCMYNIANATFNANMANTVGFGVASQLDIIQSSCNFGAAQQGSWFVAMAVDISNTQNDAFSMRLGAPLTTGAPYSITWYDRGWSPYATNVLEVGLSTTNNTFGSLLYTTPLPTINSWVQRTVNFNAPNAGQFVTARVVVGSYGWTHVDNFAFGVVLPVQALSIHGFARPDGRDVLHWELEGGADLRGLSVERLDGAGAWQPVDSVAVGAGAGYDWVSAPLAGEPLPHVYRLGMRDADGLLTHTQPVVVEAASSLAAVEPLQAFPNPAAERLTVVCTDPLGAAPAGRLELVDAQGRRVLSQPAAAENVLSVDDLAAGPYWLRWVSPSKVWTKLVLVE